MSPGLHCEIRRFFLSTKILIFFNLKIFILLRQKTYHEPENCCAGWQFYKSVSVFYEYTFGFYKLGFEK